MLPREIVVVRHAESDGNIFDSDERTKISIPTHMYGVTPRGVQQGLATKKFLEANGYIDFDEYFCSYYNRVCLTTGILFPNQPYFEDPRLAEGRRGHYHHLTKAEMLAKYPEELERKDKEGLYHYCPFGGENWADAELRILSFNNTLETKYANKRIFMCVHGFWFLLFQRLIHKFSIKKAVEIYENKTGIVANASFSRYVNQNEKLILTHYNYIPWSTEKQECYGMLPPWTI